MSYSSDLSDLRNGDLTFDNFAKSHKVTFGKWASYFLARWPQSSIDHEDLVQEAMIEAWRAVDAWDPERVPLAPLESFVRFRVGRKLRIELERVLGWPKKTRGHEAIRPVSRDDSNLAKWIDGNTWNVDRSISQPDRIELVETIGETLKDQPQLLREVTMGVGMGLSFRGVASKLFADQKSREAYEFESSEHALILAKRAGRQAVQAMKRYRRKRR